MILLFLVKESSEIDKGGGLSAEDTGKGLSF
jgi:hypothetical protein